MYFVSLHYSSSINYKHEGARSEQAICSTLHLSVSYDVIAVLYAAYCPPGHPVVSKSALYFCISFHFPEPKHGRYVPFTQRLTSIVELMIKS